MPAQEYRIRRDARQASRDELTWQHNRLADGRLAMVGLAALLAWLTFSRHLVHPGWLAIPVILFIALAVLHDRVLVARDCARRAMAFYDRGLARIGDRWAGMGSTGAAFQPEEHPYAADLDLFGRGSVFELLSTARLSAGERTLASWLLAPASPADQEQALPLYAGSADRDRRATWPWRTEASARAGEAPAARIGRSPRSHAPCRPCPVIEGRGWQAKASTGLRSSQAKVDG